MSEESWYDVAQICLNGHIINESAKSHPHSSSKFCPICGAATITECPNCNTSIRGFHNIPGVIHFSHISLPLYCIGCGHPYPWTESTLQAAQELTDELDLTDDEKTALKSDLQDIIQNTPRAQVATIRFKRLMTKVGPGTANLFKEIFVGVVSATIVKAMFP